MFWEASSGGAFNKETVVGGFDRSVFEMLYVVRIPTPSGSFVPGYLEDSKKEASAVVDGAVVCSADYQTLVNPDDVFLEWIVPDGDRIPTGAVLADDTDVKKIFMARGKFNNDYVPGVMIPTDEEDFCFVVADGKVVTFKPGEYEVLCVNTVTSVVKAWIIERINKTISYKTVVTFKQTEWKRMIARISLRVLLH